MQPAARSGVDAARDLLRVAAARACRRARRRARVRRARARADPRAGGAVSRRLAARLGARRGCRSRSRGRGGRGARRSGPRPGELEAHADDGPPRSLAALPRRRRGAAATLGPWLVVVLLGCGAVELVLRRAARAEPGLSSLAPLPLLAAAAVASGGLLSLVWVAFKVGALSYGGGFVIVPLMQADAVNHYHWMTSGQFLDAVALGQITPGPVVQTVAVVGYAAAGVGGGLLAAAVAFSPSFAFVLLGGDRFDRIRARRACPHVSRRRRPGGDRRDPRLGGPARAGAVGAVAGRRPRGRRGAPARATPRRRPDARRRRRRRRRDRPLRRPTPQLMGGGASPRSDDAVHQRRLYRGSGPVAGEKERR